MQLNFFDQHPESQDNFFERKRKWSSTKHRIILKFIQVFAFKLGRTINFVDGFAGNGKYEEGFGLKDFLETSNFWKKHSSYFRDTDGSPLIALKCASIFRDEDRLNLRCFFAELDKSSNQRLRNNCMESGITTDYQIYEPKPFNCILPKILEDLEGHPTIFFLDPFGVKGITFEDIAQISKYVCQFKGEVFLLFNNRAVARSAGHYKLFYKTDKDFKSSNTYTQHLTSLLGPNSEEIWKENYIALKNNAQQFEQWALNFFKSQLKQYADFKGVSSCEIREFYNDRPQYSIVVGSNHPQSAFGEFLNEFFCQEEKLLFYEEDAASNNSRFMDNAWKKLQQERVNAVSVEAYAILQQTKSWTKVDDLITDLILGIDRIGILNRSLYRSFIEQLHEEKKLISKNLGKKGQLTLESSVKWYN